MSYANQAQFVSNRLPLGHESARVANGEAIADDAAPHGRLCAVHLIDRRTGCAHRINGTPLIIFTHDPHAARAELLAGRDPALWDTLIEALPAAVRPASAGGSRNPNQKARA